MPRKRAELAELTSQLELDVWRGQVLPAQAQKGPRPARISTSSPRRSRSSRNYDELTEAWNGWHDIARRCASRLRALRRARERRRARAGLQGSRRDVALRATTCRPTTSTKEAERLWQQVKPLYDELHCYARAQLAKKYGADKVPDGKPIPAHLLGNMWAQQWNNIYDDLLKPYPGRQHRNARTAAEGAEVGRGADDAARRRASTPRSASRSCRRLSGSARCSTRPRDREVVCHASAWDMDSKDDVRIKMCIEPTRGRPVHDLSRARPRLLLPVVQRAAAPLPGRRARRLPRGHRRHGQPLGDAGLSAKIGLVGAGEAEPRKP